MPFEAGYQNLLFMKLTGQSSYTELCDFRHEWTESDEGHEVTSACHEGVQAFVASILRGEGTASFHIKSEQYPSDLGIVAQATGLFQPEFGDQRSPTIPFFISRVSHTNETAAGTDYTVTFKLNAEAGTYSRA